VPRPDTFVEQVLAPALRDRPGAIVVLDNLAAHKADVVRAALDRAGLGYRYLPGIMEQTHLVVRRRHLMPPPSLRMVCRRRR
jgi:hypothetical protein